MKMDGGDCFWFKVVGATKIQKNTRFVLNKKQHFKNGEYFQIF